MALIVASVGVKFIITGIKYHQVTPNTYRRGYRSSTRPRGLSIVAINAVGPASTGISRLIPRRRTWTRFGCGCSARSAKRVAPFAAICAGCGERPQSMKKGTSPSATTHQGSVNFHLSSTPSGRWRLPASTIPSSTPFRPAVSRSCSRSWPLAPTRRVENVSANPARRGEE